jgi:hypothetical protein
MMERSLQSQVLFVGHPRALRVGTELRSINASGRDRVYSYLVGGEIDRQATVESQQRGLAGVVRQASLLRDKATDRIHIDDGPAACSDHGLGGIFRAKRGALDVDGENLVQSASVTSCEPKTNAAALLTRM